MAKTNKMAEIDLIYSLNCIHDELNKTMCRSFARQKTIHSPVYKTDSSVYLEDPTVYLPDLTRVSSEPTSVLPGPNRVLPGP